MSSRLRGLVAALVTLVALLAIGWSLSDVRPDDASIVERSLSAGEREQLARLQALFPSDQGFLLALVEHTDEHDSVAAISQALDAVDGIAWVSPVGVEGALSAFSHPAETSWVLLAALEHGYRDWDRARELDVELQRLSDRLSAGGIAVSVVGEPRVRVAAWHAVQRESAYLLPVLVLVVVAVPWLVFGDWRAVVLPLFVANLTCAATLVAMTFVHGTLQALVLILLPLIFAIATLDAIHLYAAQQRSGRAPYALMSVALPCALTTLTTLGGLLLLASHNASPLISRFGIWGAVATVLAYAVTFTFGRQLLAILPPRRSRTPAKLAWRLQHLIVWARRNRYAVVGVWTALLVAAGSLLPGLSLRSNYPHLLEADAPVERTILRLEALLDTDLNAFEIYVQGDTAHGREPRALATAVAVVSSRLRSFPQTRLVLPFDALPGIGDARAFQAAGDSPHVHHWYAEGEGVVRIVLQLRATGYDTQQRIFDALATFDEQVLKHHVLHFGGSGYLHLQNERRQLPAAARGVIAALLIALLACLYLLRRVPQTLFALSGSLLPLIFTGAVLVLGGAAWHVSLLTLPIVLLVLAVDDTLHLVWRVRRAGRPGTAIARAARRAGPALLATTLVLCCSVLVLAFSALRVNRELGLLLPVGLGVALLCNLTLVPALFELRSVRRSGRASRDGTV